jgi:hypothetical protein
MLIVEFGFEGKVPAYEEGISTFWGQHVQIERSISMVTKLVTPSFPQWMCNYAMGFQKSKNFVNVAVYTNTNNKEVCMKMIT